MVGISPRVPELSIIVPVYNERDNIVPLTRALAAALGGIAWEVVFVDDDSPDQTSAEVARLAAADPRVRLIHRIGRHGLSSACVEGILSTTSPYAAVMDGDLQHDEAALPAMLAVAQEQQLDLVVGSRHIKGGSMGSFAARRVRLSNLGRWLTLRLTRCRLSDPMSGFFLLSRPFFNLTVQSLSQMGFKILLDIFASSPRPVRFAEVPYTFRDRAHGASKLDVTVNIDFLLLLADKKLGDLFPVRYFFYAMVGAVGVAVHFSVLFLLYRLLGVPLFWGQWVAAFCSMLSNFLLNNTFTYRDRKLKGLRSTLMGFLAYAAGCSFGLFLNSSVTSALQSKQISWVTAATFGVMVGSIWNYAVAATFTWKLLQLRKRTRSASSAATAVQTAVLLATTLVYCLPRHLPINASLSEIGWTAPPVSNS